MSGVLVAYFSRTGHTRRLAEALARECGGDLDPIRDLARRAGVFGYLRCAREALARAVVSLEPAAKPLRDYGLVIVGTPVWAQHVSSPVRSYLAAHKAEIERVAFFCTQGGSGADAVLREMAALAGRDPVATLAVNQRDVARGNYAAALQRFVRALDIGHG